MNHLQNCEIKIAKKNYTTQVFFRTNLPTVANLATDARILHYIGCIKKLVGIVGEFITCELTSAKLT